MLAFVLLGWQYIDSISGGNVGVVTSDGDNDGDSDVIVILTVAAAVPLIVLVFM